MEIKAVRSYKSPKYPTSIEVDENKGLLREPLERWKKAGITSALLITLLSCNSISNAVSSGISPSPSGELIAGNLPAYHPNPIFHNYALNYEVSKDSVKKTLFVEGLEEKCATTKTEFVNVIKRLLDWAFIQKLM